MKKLFMLLAMATMVASFAACGDDKNDGKKDDTEKPEPDLPVVGPIKLVAEFNAYTHGMDGWLENDKVGVFVTSDGYPQNNLLYIPAEDNTLVADGEEAAFKAGEHSVYAYYPYSEGDFDYKSIPFPDMTNQVWDGNYSFATPIYDFAYAKGTMDEYSSDNTLNLNELTSICTQVTMLLMFEEGAQDKTISKIEVISENIDLAYTNATISLADGKVTGLASRTAVLNIPTEKELMIMKDYFGDVSIIPVALMTAIRDKQSAKDQQFTIKAYTSDGKIYSASGKLNVSTDDTNNIGYSTNPGFMGVLEEE